MNSATVRVLAASNDSVSVPTIPLKITPGIKIEQEATLWAERLFSQAKSNNDVARFAASL